MTSVLLLLSCCSSSHFKKTSAGILCEGPVLFHCVDLAVRAPVGSDSSPMVLGSQEELPTSLHRPSGFDPETELQVPGEKLVQTFL